MVAEPRGRGLHLGCPGRGPSLSFDPAPSVDTVQREKGPGPRAPFRTLDPPDGRVQPEVRHCLFETCQGSGRSLESGRIEVPGRGGLRSRLPTGLLHRRRALCLSRLHRTASVPPGRARRSPGGGPHERDPDSGPNGNARGTRPGSPALSGQPGRAGTDSRQTARARHFQEDRGRPEGPGRCKHPVQCCHGGQPGECPGHGRACGARPRPGCDDRALHLALRPGHGRGDGEGVDEGAHRRLPACRRQGPVPGSARGQPRGDAGSGFRTGRHPVRPGERGLGISGRGAGRRRVPDARHGGPGGLPGRLDRARHREGLAREPPARANPLPFPDTGAEDEGGPVEADPWGRRPGPLLCAQGRKEGCPPAPGRSVPSPVP